MNKTTKDAILYYATKEGYDWDGDVVDFEGKRYYVNLSEEYVKFLRNVED